MLILNSCLIAVQTSFEIGDFIQLEFEQIQKNGNWNMRLSDRMCQDVT